MLILLVVVYDIQIHKMNVKTTLLNGELKEDIYIEELEDFEVLGKEKKVCELVKSHI